MARIQRQPDPACRETECIRGQLLQSGLALTDKCWLQKSNGTSMQTNLATVYHAAHRRHAGRAEDGCPRETSFNQIARFSMLSTGIFTRRRVGLRLDLGGEWAPLTSVARLIVFF